MRGPSRTSGVAITVRTGPVELSARVAGAISNIGGRNHRSGRVRRPARKLRRPSRTSEVAIGRAAVSMTQFLGGRRDDLEHRGSQSAASGADPDSASVAGATSNIEGRNSVAWRLDRAHAVLQGRSRTSEVTILWPTASTPTGRSVAGAISTSGVTILPGLLTPIGPLTLQRPSRTSGAARQPPLRGWPARHQRSQGLLRHRA